MCADLSSPPELPEEDTASEGELQSDEDTALQWLSEPAPNFGRHLSGFGHVFTLLNSLVTERSLKLLQGKDHADSAEVPTRSSLQVHPHAVLTQYKSTYECNLHQ